MKTFLNPQESNAPIKEFNYEGCRYSGIAVGLTFSVLSEGMAEFLVETFPHLKEVELAPIAQNEYCCSKCGKDCGSKYMKERHEKVCKEVSAGMAPILKPNFIFWNYKNLDKTQLTPDLLLPENLGQPVPITENFISEEENSQPAPGRPGTAMIGKQIQPVTTDRDGIDWYGDGLTDDIAN